MPINNLRGLYQNLREYVTPETNESNQFMTLPTVYFNDTITNETLAMQQGSPNYINSAVYSGMSQITSNENNMYGVTSQQPVRDIGSNNVFYKGEALDVVLTGLLQNIEELKIDNTRLKLAYEEILDEALKEQT